MTPLEIIAGYYEAYKQLQSLVGTRVFIINPESRMVRVQQISAINGGSAIRVNLTNPGSTAVEYHDVALSSLKLFFTNSQALEALICMNRLAELQAITKINETDLTKKETK